jgi:hypothetical protein
MIEISPTEGIAIMLRKLFRTCAPACIILLAVCATPWLAASRGATIIGSAVPLSTLVAPGGTITVGDKTFTNFTYNFTGDMPPSGGVNVVPITDDAGNFGIRFQGAFIDVPSSPGGSDALITYTVTAGTGRLISDAHLEGNPLMLGTRGSISVTETFLPLGANGEFTMKIYDDESIPLPKLVDNVIFTTPTKSLNVQKDILGLGLSSDTAGPQTVTMSFVDQTFSQVPEASTVLLSLIACIGFAAKRRR